MLASVHASHIRTVQHHFRVKASRFTTHSCCQCTQRDAHTQYAHMHSTSRAFVGLIFSSHASPDFFIYLFFCGGVGGVILFLCMNHSHILQMKCLGWLLWGNVDVKSALVVWLHPSILDPHRSPLSSSFSHCIICRCVLSNWRLIGCQSLPVPFEFCRVTMATTL